MRTFPETRAVQDALRVVTDPAFALAGGLPLRRLAWWTLMATPACQRRAGLFRRPTDGDAA